MVGAVSSRRLHRARALEILYEADAKGVSPRLVLDELPAPPERFVIQMVEGVSEQVVSLDEMISARSIGWPVGRMARIDLSLLRMASWELVNAPETPSGVIVSEAVELAAQYSTAESAKFVNGILAAVALDIRPATSRDEGA